MLIARLKVGPGDRVLDVGCGIGKPGMQVATATGASVVGITISASQVEQAQRRAVDEGMADRVSFEYADGMDMPYQDASFDAILSFESINHMERPVALREFTRVLRPGGRLVLTDVTADNDDPYRADEHPDAVSSLVRIGDWPALVTGAGLVLDELTDVTEQTKGTMNRMIDNILKCRKDFEAKHGITVQEVFDQAKSALPTVPSTGCAIVVAHKP
jgi:ubiquinone/menaquinone biosynthesis C-methylase UbiE